MPQRRFEFIMPAEASVVFDAFHYHAWRSRWDSLVGVTKVEGGAPCPYVGAITVNTAAGLLRGLSMRTRFVSFQRPSLAAASTVGRSFPFARWAASMRHRPLDGGHSLLIYTYNFTVDRSPLRWVIEPVVRCLFFWETQRRLRRLQRFRAAHASEVAQWQVDQATNSVQASVF